MPLRSRFNTPPRLVGCCHTRYGVGYYVAPTVPARSTVRTPDYACLYAVPITFGYPHTHPGLLAPVATHMLDPHYGGSVAAHRMPHYGYPALRVAFAFSAVWIPFGLPLFTRGNTHAVCCPAALYTTTVPGLYVGLTTGLIARGCTRLGWLVPRGTHPGYSRWHFTRCPCQLYGLAFTFTVVLYHFVPAFWITTIYATHRFRFENTRCGSRTTLRFWLRTPTRAHTHTHYGYRLV